MSASGLDPQPIRSAYADSKNEMRDDLEALRHDIASLASTVSKLAGDSLGAAAGTAQTMAKEKLTDVEAAIRQNPTQAALIAVGVGFLIGLIFTK